jgi:hypothetical protein
MPVSAIRALELIGKELGMFIRKEVVKRHKQTLIARGALYLQPSILNRIFRQAAATF